MKPQANYYSRTEINQRENNEDSLDKSEFYITGEPPIAVLSVADGMGGHAHGEDVSREGLLKFSITLFGEFKAVDSSPPFDVERLKRALIVAMQQANNHVRRMVSANQWEKAGSTIVSVAIWRNHLVAVNLGDSPLFHYEAKTGKLVKVTLDHSVPAILAQAGLITEEMARYHERRGQLEFFLGADSMPDPLPVYERTIEPDDLLLLCSDGVSAAVSLEQIKQILARTDLNLEQKGDALIQAARDAGETDNQTLMLWCCLDSSESQSNSRSIANSSMANYRLPQTTHIQERRDPNMLNPPSAPIELNYSPPTATTIQSVHNSQSNLIHRSIAAKNKSWLLFITALVASLVLIISNLPELLQYLNLLRFPPQKTEELLKHSSPKSPESLPKKLPQNSPQEI